MEYTLQGLSHSSIDRLEGDSGAVDLLLDDVLAGQRLTPEEAYALFCLNDRWVWKVAASADEKRKKCNGDVVTYVRNQNINVTNLCINSCGFCGFSKEPGDEGAYFHDRETIREKILEAKSRGVSEICTVSGLHPDFDAYSIGARYIIFWFLLIFFEKC